MAKEEITLEEQVEELVDALYEDVDKIMADFKEELSTMLTDAGVFDEDEEDD